MEGDYSELNEIPNEKELNIKINDQKNVQNENQDNHLKPGFENPNAGNIILPRKDVQNNVEVKDHPKIELDKNFKNIQEPKKLIRVKQEDDGDHEFDEEFAEDAAKIIPDLGRNGKGEYLFGDEARLGEIAVEKEAFNRILSDKIPYNRSLPDGRPEQ